MIRICKKAVLYARFSSDNQRSESIDAQIRAMKEYCKKNSYVIVNTYIDEAKSATHGNARIAAATATSARNLPQAIANGETGRTCVS